MVKTNTFRVVQVFFCVLFLACLPVSELRALENGLAKTPPMGCNSWNEFACNVSEELITMVLAADQVMNSREGSV